MKACKISDKELLNKRSLFSEYARTLDYSSEILEPRFSFMYVVADIYDKDKGALHLCYSTGLNRYVDTGKMFKEKAEIFVEYIKDKRIMSYVEQGDIQIRASEFLRQKVVAGEITNCSFIRKISESAKDSNVQLTPQEVKEFVKIVEELSAKNQEKNRKQEKRERPAPTPEAVTKLRKMRLKPRAVVTVKPKQTRETIVDDLKLQIDQDAMDPKSSAEDELVDYSRALIYTQNAIKNAERKKLSQDMTFAGRLQSAKDVAEGKKPL
jgi:hypothetical protein